MPKPIFPLKKAFSKGRWDMSKRQMTSASMSIAAKHLALSRMSQPNVYFFLKDCGFKRIFRENGNRFPNPESQNMCNTFQMEMQQQQWTPNKMSVGEYKMFLESYFKKMDFNTIDLDTCQSLKLITENLGVFGPFDDLTSKRIVYFNNKIDKLKAMPLKGSNSGPLSYQPSPMNTTNNNSIPQNTSASVSATFIFFLLS